MNFIQMCVAGTAKPEEIDKYVAEWNSAITALTLHEYLGMTLDEYKAWVIDPEAINIIVGRKPNKVFDIVKVNELKSMGFTISSDIIIEDQDQKPKECKNG